ncbi:peptide chain release factor 1 [Corynebacterium pyruviciproducens]|nr:peptide chain release factor 1 [Corynebacterium pyruviciproducens]MDH4657875.1 peptide chain release factor 1 [Corynebacterium pyruviciproducens]
MNDLTIAPGPGIPDGAVIAAADLAERFAKSSAPGVQGINTTDSKVQLSIDVAECASLTDTQRHRISRNLCEIGVVGTGCLRSWYWGCA